MQTPPPHAGASHSDESNGSNASQVLASGAGFGSIGFMIHLLHSIPRPRMGPGGAHGSNALGGLWHAFASLDSDQGPHLMSRLHPKWHPGL